MILFFKRFCYKHILHRHLCEEFTQWEKKQCDYERAVSVDDGYLGVNKIVYTRIWQERQCTICGKTFQEELKF